MADGVRQALTLACAWLAAVNARAPLLAIGPLLPVVMADLGVSFTAGGLLTGLPLLLMGLFGLPGGWFADRTGARRVMVYTLVGVTVAGLVRGFAANEAVLLAGTILLGVSIGILQPALPRVARDTLPQRTGLASAIYFNGLLVGGAAGLGLTPVLLNLDGALGWRGVFLGWAVLGALATLGWLLIKPARSVAPRASRVRWDDVVAAFRLPGMAALSLAMGTQSAIFYTFSSWVPSYLVARGWTLTTAALPVATLPVATIIAGALAPVAEAALGRRNVIAIGGFVTSIGVIAFLLWPDEAVWVAVIAVGLGTTLAFSVCMAAPAALAPAHRVGITAGVLLAIGYGEATLGPVALGALRDASGSYQVGWLLALGLALVLSATAFGIPGRLDSQLRPT